MIALDASVLIAHLNHLDTHHEAATRILLEAASEQLIVHHVTLTEVLVGGVRVGRGAEMQADLFAAGIRIAPHDEQETLRLAELRVTTGLKLPDCCVLDTSITNDASLATFDTTLAMAARQRGGYRSVGTGIGDGLTEEWRAIVVQDGAGSIPSRLPLSAGCKFPGGAQR